MSRIVASLALCALLAGCNNELSEPDEQLTTNPDLPPGDALDNVPPPTPPTVAQMAALDSRDCRTVARAYIDALATGEFDFAARFWDDPVIDGPRLRALFAEYGQPAVEISNVQEEGAAGTLYCTVTGALSDLADPTKPLRTGELELRRVNDVPGATEQQLRWTIRSSTFIEPMERSGTGEPA